VKAVAAVPDVLGWYSPVEAVVVVVVVVVGFKIEQSVAFVPPLEMLLRTWAKEVMDSFLM